MAGKLTIDPEALEVLANVLKDSGLTEIAYQQGDTKIKLSRSVNAPAGPAVISQPIPSVPISPPTSLEPELPQERGTAITSPIVGTAYLAPEPGAPTFVKGGETVQEGQTLLIVEAMKVMNPIRAPHGGVVREICAQNGEPVEFGETLLYVEKSSS